MNLGYGLAAVDSYFKAGDERKVREYDQAKRDAELSLMGDKTEADRNRLRLDAAQSSAGLETLPGQTANTLAKQRYEKTDLAAKEQRQGLDNAAALNKSKVAAATAEFDEKNLASTLDSMAVKNELSKQEQLDAVLGQLAKSFSANDKPRALAFANSIASASNILPEFNGKTATDIKVEQGTDKLNTGPGYRISFSDGTDLFLTQRTMSDALARVKGNAKLNFMHDKETGEVLVGNESTGQVTVARAGDPSRRVAKDTRPAEARLADYYISKGVPEDEALRRASRLKDMSPANAEFQLYKDRIGLTPNADEATKQKIRQQVKKEVEEIFSVRGTTPSGAAPTAGRGPANPNIAEVIGLGQQAPAAAPRPAPAPALSQAPATAAPSTPTAAPPQPADGSAPLSQRLAQAVQADSQGGRGNVIRLADEVSRTAPQMQQQLAALKSAVQSAAGGQRAFIEQRIAELEREITLAQGVINQAKAQRGY